MDVLQWVFIIGIAITIISFILVLYYLFQALYLGKNIRRQNNNGKRKRKSLLAKLKVKRKKHIQKLLVFLILGILAGAGSAYVTYYQSTNLSKEDTYNLTDGYYYLRDLKNELEDMKAGKIDADKSKQTINYVVTSLAGYSVKKASTLNTVEGQRVLNRYYQSMSELGINISKNSGNLIEDQKVLNDSLTDIEKAQTFQKKAMDFFKVDVSVLEKQK